MIVRDATPGDAAGCAAIYAPHVLAGTATFETDPPTPATMAARIAAVQATGWPWLVADDGGDLLGYASAAQFRDRPAYRHTGETTIYLRYDRLRQGIGGALLAALIARCETLGARQLIAVIGDADNAGSIGLHAASGFVHAGQLRDVGYKFGRWLDVVYMQRRIGERP